jgi:glycerate 2-kinase
VSEAVEPRALLENVARAAIASVDGYTSVKRVLERSQTRGDHDEGPKPTAVRLLAIGKAGVAMARAGEECLGDRIRAGLVITREGHAGDRVRSRVIESAHPVPDARSEWAGGEALAFARETAVDEQLLVLLSGGTSALISAPMSPELSLGDIACATDALLRAGASIDELNCVRKHLCAAAGGRLAAAAEGRAIEVLILSDVLGDRPEVIASGPFSADPTTFADAIAVLDRYALQDDLPSCVLEHLSGGVRGESQESAKPGARELSGVRVQIVARNRDAREAAARRARELGATPLQLGEVLRGEARDVGRRLAALSRAVASEHPICLIAGGETTVTVEGPGRGGRNQELALAAAIALGAREASDSSETCLLAVGTDGADGPTDAAGAFADARTTQRATQLGLDPYTALARNDSYGFFDREGGLLRTGPTGTNVMDLALIWVSLGRGSSSSPAPAV